MKEPLNLILCTVKEVGKDFIVVSDDSTNIKITFADTELDHHDLGFPTTKELEAAFFRSQRNGRSNNFNFPH
jgi:hypothetical protein